MIPIYTPQNSSSFSWHLQRITRLPRRIITTQRPIKITASNISKQPIWFDIADWNAHDPHVYDVFRLNMVEFLPNLLRWHLNRAIGPELGGIYQYHDTSTLIQFQLRTELQMEKDGWIVELFEELIGNASDTSVNGQSRFPSLIIVRIDLLIWGLLLKMDQPSPVLIKYSSKELLLWGAFDGTFDW